MRLNLCPLRLPEVKPGQFVAPRKCLQAGCKGKHFYLYQKVSKKVVDVRTNRCKYGATNVDNADIRFECIRRG